MGTVNGSIAVSVSALCGAAGKTPHCEQNNRTPAVTYGISGVHTTIKVRE